jgi:DNA replicative helicase MCM subunit Mcm2 (Cdc46/Mcm family)
MNKGDYRIAHQNIHHWLRYHFGPATRCDLKCDSKGPFQRALKNGEKHAKDIKRYLQLCRSCHAKYDGHAKREIDTKYVVMRKADRGDGPTAMHQLRIYPKTYEVLRRLAYKKRLTLAGVIDELAKA